MNIKFQDKIRRFINPYENESITNIRKVVYDKPVVFLNNIGATPNLINTFGLICGLIAAVLIGMGHIKIGTAFFFLSGASDSFDGPLARYQNSTTDFGAFFDSVSDRIVDISVYIGIATHYALLGEFLNAFLCLISILGASLVSYSKARAEALGVESRSIGIMGRVTRGVSLLFGLIFFNILPAILWIHAIFSNITAIRRIEFYSRELRKSSPIE
jgi:CDP-diacylglycerol---glycerol-3-phosphate 3-phosphatidyltransferase